MNYAAKLVHTRRALSSTNISFDQETVSGQACNLPDPHNIFLFPLVKGFYGTRYQSGSFSLNNVGSDFHCLHRFPLPASFFHSPFKDSSSRKKVVNKKGLGDIMRGFEGIY